MFQNFGAGNIAVFVDVTYHEHGQTIGLAQLHQRHGAVLHLGNAAGCGFTEIYLVGSEFAAAAAELKGQLGAVEPHLFEDSLQLKEHISQKPLSGWSILIKGSRGKRLERVIEAL